MVAGDRLVRSLRPSVVVGVGGYASLPGVLAARLLRIPIVIHEQNAVPGLANRLAARLGRGWRCRSPGRALPGAVVIGNPVRASRRRAGSRAGPARPMLGVVGGSLGSPRSTTPRSVSTTAGASAPTSRCRHVPDRALRRLPRADSTGCAVPGRARVRPGPVRGPHGPALRARALAVCRAGAVTVAELAAAGVPSVLVPWPGAAGDHQSDNARVDGGRRGRSAAARRRRPTARASTPSPASCCSTRPAHDDGDAAACARPPRRRGSARAIWSRRAPVPAPEPGPVLDLSEPRRIHVVGVGGAGMSSYAAILAEMGHRSAARTCTSTPLRPVAAARGRVSRAAGGRERPAGCRRRRDQLRGAAARTSRCGRRGRGHPGPVAGPTRSPAIVAAAAASASRAPTARPRRPR